MAVYEAAVREEIYWTIKSADFQAVLSEVDSEIIGCEMQIDLTVLLLFIWHSAIPSESSVGFPPPFPWLEDSMALLFIDFNNLKCILGHLP